VSTISLSQFVPPPRFDEIAWETADIEEAPDVDGAPGVWAVVEPAIALDPIDADPSRPVPRSFTTDNATAETGHWYRIAFRVGVGIAYSAPVMKGLIDPPTAADIRLWSRVLFDENGYALPESGYDPLQRLVDYAVADIQNKTGRKFDATLPADFTPGLQLAVQMHVEYQVFQGDPDAIEGLADFATIKQFSAGRYSETRRSPYEALAAEILHPWPALNALIWGVRDESVTGGAETPGVAVPEPDWDVGKDIIDAKKGNYPDSRDMRGGYLVGGPYDPTP
jgi:hypothetical protein